MPSDRLPVALIHGMLGGPEVWAPLVEALGPTAAPLLPITLPGHGLTPWGTDLATFEDAVDAVAARLPERFGVVGYLARRAVRARARRAPPLADRLGGRDRGRSRHRGRARASLAAQLGPLARGAGARSRHGSARPRVGAAAGVREPTRGRRMRARSTARAAAGPRSVGDRVGAGDAGDRLDAPAVGRPRARRSCPRCWWRARSIRSFRASLSGPRSASAGRARCSSKGRDTARCWRRRTRSRRCCGRSWTARPGPCRPPRRDVTGAGRRSASGDHDRAAGPAIARRVGARGAPRDAPGRRRAGRRRRGRRGRRPACSAGSPPSRRSSGRS
jgi:hypothetical protein